MMRRRPYMIWLLSFCLVLLLDACIKVDTLPQLEILVLDEQGSIVTGAYVALFENAGEWETRKNPVQVWRRTGTDGKVLFVDLDEATYYVYARYDGKDNSVDEAATLETLQLNQKSRIIIHLR